MSNANESWEVVDEISGQMQAAIIKSLLDSHGLQVWISQEGAGQVYQMNIGTLGRVQILVPTHQADEAKRILQEYYDGELELPNDDEESSGQEEPEG
jgi:hypothetical protein